MAGFNTQSHRVKGGVQFPQDSWKIGKIKTVKIPPSQVHLAKRMSFEELKEIASQEEE